MVTHLVRKRYYPTAVYHERAIYVSGGQNDEKRRYLLTAERYFLSNAFDISNSIIESLNPPLFSSVAFWHMKITLN